MSFARRAPLIKEGHYFGTFNVGGIYLRDLKPGFFDQLADGPIQVATAGNPLPDRGEAILPPANVEFRRKAMLDEQQLTIGSEHAMHFPQRACRVRNCA